MAVENATYNLERFEVFIISVPPLRRTAIYTLLASLLPVLLSWWSWFGRGYGDPASLPLVALAVTVAAAVGGEGIRWVIDPYPRKWGYFLAFVNHLLAVGVLLVGGFLAVVDLWTASVLAAGFMAINATQVLIITLSFRAWMRAALAAFIQPAAFVSGLAVLGVPMAPTVRDAAVVVSAVGVVIVAMWLAERMVAVNVDVRGLDFSSALTLDRALDMGIGERARRWVQTLRIDAEDGAATLAIPWFHPGLMSHIGGGRMSRAVTSTLVDAGGGSFLKPPASHKSDPSDPAAVDAIVDTMQFPAETPHDTASPLVRVDRNDLTFWGRRYGDVSVVWFDSPAFDDVEVPCWDDVVDERRQIVIDCHATEAETERNLLAGTADEEAFLAGLRETWERLDGTAQGTYEAGFANFESDVPGFALIERVDDQTTLVLGLDGNNVTEGYHELRDELAAEFDRVLLLTTDTHVSPFEIDALPPVSAARAAVQAAQDALGPASIGLAAARTPELRLLNEQYTKLIDSFNIGARFLIVCLGLSYVYFVLAVALTLG